MRNTIILLVPSTNPDGVDIVNNWYQKTLGTPYEGTDPPELYHKYTGHDDNRDWYAFSQIETQLVVDKILNVWHPQIVHDIHQQGAFELDTSNPIAAGMPKESIAWAENSPVFEIKSDPLALLRVKIIASYPRDKDPLLSGWLLGGDRIKGKAALVEVGLGKGRIILFGFRPRYRGQSLATYPLFFNAITGN